MMTPGSGETYSSLAAFSAAHLSVSPAPPHPTPQAAEATESGEIITPLRPQGSKPPLFLVHGIAGGMVWGYKKLARHLGPEQPVYVLRSPELEGGPLFSSIEEMAARYLGKIRSVRPAGPCVLGGYCFGGNVAYEMASQLAEAGEPVPPVMVINGSPPNSRYDEVHWNRELTCRFVRNLAGWTAGALHWEPARIREFMLWKLRKLRRHLRETRVGRPHEFTADDVVDMKSCPPAERRALANHVRLLRNYRHRPGPVRVSLFRTRSHPMFCSFDPLYGWADYALRGVDVRAIPGTHENILKEPRVRSLALQLRAALNST